MVAMDLGPEARYKDVRCVNYERSASKVNRVQLKTQEFVAKCRSLCATRARTAHATAQVPAKCLTGLRKAMRL